MATQPKQIFVKIIAYSDYSFSNCDDLGTQLGFVILLTDNTNRQNWFPYASYRCRRVVTSVPAGVTYAFADGFDTAYTIKYDLQQIMIHHSPLTIPTDSEILFKINVKSSTTTEKKLRIVIKATTEAFAKSEVSNIGWVQTHKNLADGLTKLTTCDVLEKLLDTGTMNLQVEKWFYGAMINHSLQTNLEKLVPEFPLKILESK